MNNREGNGEIVKQAEGGEREESARGESEKVDLLTLEVSLSTTDILVTYPSRFSRVGVKSRKKTGIAFFGTAPV